MDAAKRYYEKNKTRILADEKDKKRWLSYYERNKEAIKARNLERYYAKSGKTSPPPRPPVIPPDPISVARMEELIQELRVLIPKVMKTKRTKKAKSDSPGSSSDAALDSVSDDVPVETVDNTLVTA